MFRVPDQLGLGNILIFLSQLDDKIPVSKNILSGFRGKYLKFKNLNIMDDDPELETHCPPIYINPWTLKNVHPLCINKVEPSDHMNEIIRRNSNLVSGVKAGLAIRFGNTRKTDMDTIPFIDDHGLKQFHGIIESNDGPFFIACDRLDYKYELKKRYGEKIRFVESDCVIIHNSNQVDSPDPYLEFFLLSMCPIVIITGGPKDMHAFSTFGYMASMWGQKPFEVVWNAT
jgi:hypothetical protein